MSEFKSKTNKELINDIIDNSKFGVLAQVFVIDALTKFSNNVVVKREELLKEEEENLNNNKIGFISMKGWVGVAEEINVKLKNNN